MRKLLALAAVSGLLVPALFVGTASAHVKKTETTLTIDSSPAGNRVLVFGKIKPKKCALDQKVKVYEAGPGSDRVLGSDRLDNDGEYSVRIPADSGRVYAKVKSAVIVSNYQHTHKCKGDKSPTINVS